MDKYSLSFADLGYKVMEAAPLIKELGEEYALELRQISNFVNQRISNKKPYNQSSVGSIKKIAIELFGGWEKIVHSLGYFVPFDKEGNVKSKSEVSSEIKKLIKSGGALSKRVQLLAEYYYGGVDNLPPSFYPSKKITREYLRRNKSEHKKIQMGSFDERSTKKLGKYLKKKREESGWSQGRLAVYLGYSSGQHVSNWERGKVTPSTDTLILLVDLIKIPQEELIKLMCKLYRETLNRGL